MPDVITIAPRARAAWPWLPPAAPARSVWFGPTGEVVRVREDGGADAVFMGGRPHGGIAADPTAARAEPRGAHFSASRSPDETWGTVREADPRGDRAPPSAVFPSARS